MQAKRNQSSFQEKKVFNFSLYNMLTTIGFLQVAFVVKSCWAAGAQKNLRLLSKYFSRYMT